MSKPKFTRTKPTPPRSDTPLTRALEQTAACRAAKRPKLPNWRNNSDVAYHGYTSLPSAPSLHPGPSTVLAAVAGDKESQAIIDSYACRLPVTLVASIEEVSL